jgi:hypothetical protein
VNRHLSGPGKGVLPIGVGDEDRVLGFIASSGDRDPFTVETTRGAEQTISTAKYEATGRGKGRSCPAGPVHPDRLADARGAPPSGF